MNTMLKIKNRCPFCNCKLKDAIVKDENDNFFIKLLCSNHKYNGNKTSLAFDYGIQDLEKMIKRIKKGSITVIRETVSFRNFITKLK